MWDYVGVPWKAPLKSHGLLSFGHLGTPLSNTPRCEERITTVQASSNSNDDAKHMSLKMFTRTRAFGCMRHDATCTVGIWIAELLPTTHTYTSTSVSTECQQSFPGTGIQTACFFPHVMAEPSKLQHLVEVGILCLHQLILLMLLQCEPIQVPKHRRPSEICLAVLPIFQCLRL